MKKIFSVLLLSVVVMFSCSDNKEKRYSLEAKDTIKNILESSLKYSSSHGYSPSDIDDLLNEGYIVISKEILKKWSFELDVYGVEYMGIEGVISAQSLPKMEDGEGKEIIFDIVTGQYKGYGCEIPIHEPVSNNKNKPTCLYQGASSFAEERAMYALSTISEINEVDSGLMQGMGYDSDYGFLVDGYNKYGRYTVLTILISCIDGDYNVDFVNASN